MHAHIPIKRDSHLHHPAGRHIPYQRHAGERTSRKPFIAVDDVLVAANEDAQDAVAEEHGRDERRPIRDARVCRPAHPEEGDRDGRAAEHAEPEAELGGQAMAAACFDLGEVALGPDVDDGDEEAGEAEADANAEESEAGDAFGETVGGGEDEGVAVEEGEEDDVDDGKVEGDEHDDWFAEGEQKGAVERDTETAQEGFLANLDFGSIPVVSCEFAQVRCFPLQENRGVGFWLQEHDEREYKSGDYQRNPFCPSPRHERGFANETPNHRAKDRTHERGVGKDRKHVNALHWTPKVRDGATSACQGRRTKEACNEAKGELGTDIRGEGGGHDEDHIKGEGSDVHGVSANRFGNGTGKERACSKADEKETSCKGLGDFAYSKVFGCLRESCRVDAGCESYDPTDCCNGNSKEVRLNSVNWWRIIRCPKSSYK